MSNEGFKEISTEDLVKREKSMKRLILILIVGILTLLASSVFSVIKKQEYFVTLTMAIINLLILVININMLRSLKAEIERRQGKFF